MRPSSFIVGYLRVTVRPDLTLNMYIECTSCGHGFGIPLTSFINWIHRGHCPIVPCRTRYSEEFVAEIRSVYYLAGQAGIEAYFYG